MNKEYLKFAIEIAQQAGKIMLDYFNKDNKSRYKLDNTIVTEADNKINEYLIKRVKETYPTHSVQGEEECFGKSTHTWICDPIDGTAMYARNIPVAVFSLALAIDGSPIVGVVYDPFTENMYYATKGEGAYKNNEKIEVNDIALGDMRSVANFDMWAKAEYDIHDVIRNLEEKTYFVSIGSVIRGAMCVATGDFTFAIFPGTKNKNYDIAALKVIVEASGGIVTDIFGNEQRYDQDINGTIISNKVVYEEVLAEIKRSIKKRSIYE